MSLSRRVLIKLMLSFFVVMVAYSFFEAERERKHHLLDAQNLHEILIHNAYPEVTHSLWNVDRLGIKSTLSALFQHGHVQRAFVFDEQGKVFSSDVRLQDPSGISFEPNKPTHAFSRELFGMVSEPRSIGDSLHRFTASLWYVPNGSEAARFLGHFVVDYSTQYVVHQVRETQLRVALWSLGLGAILVIITTYVLKSDVISPIGSLVSAAKAVSRGEFVEVSKTQHDDEIGTLTKSFNKMIRSVYASFLSLRILEQEQLKIAGSMDYQVLGSQIQSSVRALLKRNVEMRLQWFLPSSGFLAAAAAPPAPGFLRFKISDAKRGKVVAYLDVEHSFTLEEGEEQESLVRMLLMSAGTAIENIQFAQEQQHRLRMQTELDTARLVQQSLIPPSQSLRFGRYEMASFFVSASECCGDWWNYYPLRDGRMLVLLGDVTGHGTASALIASLAKGFCDSIYWRTNWSPAEILEDLNSVICASGSETHPYMSMFVALIDPFEQSIEYASAGHPHPYIVHTSADKPAYSRLLSVGPLLGWKSGVGSDSGVSQKYVNKRQAFENGDILLVYSDGLLENKNDDDEMFLESNLRRVLKSQWGRTATELHKKIAETQKSFSKNRPVDDDMTFVAVQLCENVEPVVAVANIDSLKQKMLL